jgi:hypothetical protein
LPACYQLRAELGILLDAVGARRGSFATHYSSRTRAITYFQLRAPAPLLRRSPNGRRTGTRVGPESAGCHLQLSTACPGPRCGRARAMGDEAHSCGPLPAEAAALICFFGCGEGFGSRSYQLNIHADGEKLHVDGPGVSGDLGR